MSTAWALIAPYLSGEFAVGFLVVNSFEPVVEETEDETGHPPRAEGDRCDPKGVIFLIA